jgi:outer membrane protein assembly factor BamB
MAIRRFLRQQIRVWFHGQRKATRVKTIATAMLVIGVLSGEVCMAAETASTDWPQWRGPDRNGVAGPGPKLADAWPEGGPKLLWKSGPIPCGWDKGPLTGLGGEDGGLSGITVVGEKAFVYVHWKRKGTAVVISTKDMEDFGWMAGVPDDLGKKVDDEVARIRAKDPKDSPQNRRWRIRFDDPKRESFIKEIPKTFDSKLVEQFGPWIEKRANILWRTHPNEIKAWDNLAKIAELRDKEFTTYADLEAEVQKRGFGDAFGQVAGWNPAGDLVGRLQTMGRTFTDTVICLDVSTGKEVWKAEFPGAPSKEACYIGASGTPAVWDGNVYASGSAGLYCLSVKDGSVVWQAKTSFTHSSPLVANGGIFLMLKEGLMAFDAKTGKVLWTQPKIRNNCASVAKWTNGGKHYLIVGNLLIDQTSGDVVWTGPTGAHNATPVVCGDVVLILEDSSMHAIGLTATQGGLLWTQSGRCGCSNASATPVVYQGVIYMTGARYCNTLFCLDFKTGEVKWQFSPQTESTSAIAADGKVFGLAGDHRLMMFKATPEKFELLGLGSKQDLAPHGPSPSIANGRLYVRLADCVACYDITAAGNPAVTPPSEGIPLKSRTKMEKTQR